MRKYELVLVERCLDVLQHAAQTPGDVRTAGVRLALWALRPYCSADTLSRFWAFCARQNPMYEQSWRFTAIDAVRRGCRLPDRKG